MAVKVEIPYRKTWSSPVNAAATYAYLADVARSVPENFPGMEKFSESSPGVYRWEFEKLAYAGQEVRIALTTKLDFQPETAIIVTPAGGKGDGRLTGGWRITPKENRAEVDFDFSLELELPLPFFTKAVVVPLAQKELTKLFDRYVENVAKHLA